MNIRRRKGFTITEILITTLITGFTVMGCWAIYVVGHDFYQNSLHQIRAQSATRTAMEVMLYGLNVAGNNKPYGLQQAEQYTVTITTTTAEIICTEDLGEPTQFSWRFTWDQANWQISYTDDNNNNIAITPPYVQANGGIAVTQFNPSTFDSNLTNPGDEGVSIDFRVESLLPNTSADPTLHGTDAIKADIDMELNARGRVI